MIKHVKTGDRVEIGFKSEKDASRRKLSTIVEAVLSSKEVLIMMPISAGTMIKLPLDRDLEARFYTGSSVIMYDVTAIEHPVIDGSYLTKLRLDSRGERVQLRDFYRITSAIDFNFSLAQDQFAEEELTLYKAITKDFSAGGMSFATDLELEDKTELYANFILDGEYIVILGRAMGRQKSAGAYKYQYRCQFLALPDADQEKIVKYINNQQFKTLWQTRDGV